MDKLKFINEQMDILAVPYEFDEWTSDVRYPYFVGEFPSPEDITTEDGLEQSTLLLTGFARGSNAIENLEEAKEKIKKHFHSVYGLRASTESGTIAVFYGGAFFVPSNEAELKKIQINLIIKEWKGAV